KYVVTLVDYFSKYPEILLTGSITSSKIIDWLDDIFSRLGNPDNLVTDNGPQFVSMEFTDFLCAKNIQHDRTAVYNPAENGLVEVVNRMWKYGAQAIFAEGIRFKNGMRNLIASFQSTPPENSKSPTICDLILIRNPSLLAQG
ncbi:MAG: transposase family protein, partial [Gammaproteobacteria bacterium]|nr:transposase family protein [Gammaproteobacteria bacterium]